MRSRRPTPHGILTTPSVAPARPLLALRVFSSACCSFCLAHHHADLAILINEERVRPRSTGIGPLWEGYLTTALTGQYLAEDAAPGAVTPDAAFAILGRRSGN